MSHEGCRENALYHEMGKIFRFQETAWCQSDNPIYDITGALFCSSISLRDLRGKRYEVFSGNEVVEEGTDSPRHHVKFFTPEQFVRELKLLDTYVVTDAELKCTEDCVRLCLQQIGIDTAIVDINNMRENDDNLYNWMEDNDELMDPSDSSGEEDYQPPRDEGESSSEEEHEDESSEEEEEEDSGEHPEIDRRVF